MGDQVPLELRNGDFFLRRASTKSALRRGVVYYKAFLDRHSTLSFTLRDANLRSDSGLRQYQLDKKLPHGDLPGICQLSFEDLTERLGPPLSPRHAPDSEDNEYGRLHCVTDTPCDDDHCRKMAVLANMHGVLDFVRKKRGGDPMAAS